MKRILGVLHAIFIEDFSLKAISILTAVALFAFVRGAEGAQKSVYVGLITLLPDQASGRILVSDPPARVGVTLRGSRAQLSAIRPETLPAIQLDLREAAGSRYYFGEGDLELPVGVEVVEWTPASIPLEYAVRGERQVPVRVRLVGEPRSGIRLVGEARVRPRDVLLAGPEQTLEGLAVVHTQDVHLDDLDTGDREVRVRLRPPPPHAEFPTGDLVTVSLRLAPEKATRRLENVEVEAMGGLAQRIRPRRVDLTVHGPPETVTAIDEDAIIPWVNVDGLPHHRGAQPVPVEVRGLPEGVVVEGISPAEVLVTPSGS